MNRKVIVIASMVSLSMLSELGGTTVFAQGTGEYTKTATTTTTNSFNITTYYQDAVRGLGGWEQVSETGDWKFKLNTSGEYLTRSWVESLTESGAFYYLNDYGIMSISATTPDGYTVDSNGLYRSATVAYNNDAKNTESDKPSNESDDRGKYMQSDEYQKFLDGRSWSTGVYGSLD